jgi:hypothetical protein
VVEPHAHASPLLPIVTLDPPLTTRTPVVPT